MPVLQTLMARPQGRPPKPCAWCDRPATIRVEVRLTEIIPNQKRGPHITSRTPGMCHDHAAVYVAFGDHGRRLPKVVVQLAQMLGVTS